MFIEKFQEIKYGTSPKNRKLIKYILSKFENHLHGRNEFTLNHQVINIEHVLPQTPDNWGLTKQEIKEYVNNLGNLVLIDQSLNGQMGNKSLADKTPILCQSNLKMNKLIVEQIKENDNVWDQISIEKRNEDIATVSYDSIWQF